MISLKKIIQKIILTIITTFLCVEFIIIVYRIISRRLPVLYPVPEEIAFFFVVWMLYLGAAYLLSLGLDAEEEGHLRVNMVELFFIKNEKNKLKYQVLILSVIILFDIMFIYSASFMIELSKIRSTMTLHLPYIYWYAAPWVSSLAMLYFTIIEIIITIKKIRLIGNSSSENKED